MIRLFFILVLWLDDSLVYSIVLYARTVCARYKVKTLTPQFFTDTSLLPPVLRDPCSSLNQPLHCQLLLQWFPIHACCIPLSLCFGPPSHHGLRCSSVLCTFPLLVSNDKCLARARKHTLFEKGSKSQGLVTCAPRKPCDLRA